MVSTWDDGRHLARIRDARLFIEDHGILTFFLDLDYEEGSSQGFGGFSLGGFDRDGNIRNDGGFTGAAIRGVLDAVGVEDWKDLPGKMVYAHKEGGLIRAIEGLYLTTKNKKVDLKDLAEQARKNAD